MQNEELLLSNYDFIMELMKARIKPKQITKDVNQRLGIQITTRQLRYLIDKVNSNAVHKEYDNIILIDNIMDAWDAKLGEYCVDFHGLLITYKSAAHLTKPEYIITPNNLISISSKESLLYAKRLLKLYHLSDVNLLAQHKIIHPKQHEINLNHHLEQIRVDFYNEFATMQIALHNKYVEFLSNNIKGICNAK